MSGYRAILFDADDTLFDYPAAEREALQEVWRSCAPSSSWERFRDVYTRHNLALWRDLEAGRTTPGALKSERFRRAFAELGVSAPAGDAGSRYIEALAAQTQLLPGARELAERLAARYPLGLVTNGLAAVQTRRFARSAIGHLFAAVAISEVLGVAKPDPRIFHPVLDELGVSSRDVLYVGDSVTSDMAAARNAAIDFCWFNPAGLPVPEGFAPAYVVRTLKEIEVILA